MSLEVNLNNQITCTGYSYVLGDDLVDSVAFVPR